MISEAVRLTKANGKLGVDGERIIVLVCNLAKLFFRALLSRSEFEAPSHVYGGLPGRRREAAIAVQQCISWRLLYEAKECHVKRMHDARNAYYAISQSCLQDAVKDLFDPPDRELVQYRISRATIRFFDMPVDQLLLLCQGGLPGDPLMVHVFVTRTRRCVVMCPRLPTT